MQGLGDQAEPCNGIPGGPYNRLWLPEDTLSLPGRAACWVEKEGVSCGPGCCRGPEANLRDEGTYLALHQHGHVHEHIVQLPDTVLQLDDLTVSGLNLTEGLLRDAGVHDDLEGRAEGPRC